MIIDGKKESGIILDKIKNSILSFDTKPSLAVVIIGDDPASQVYVKNKILACEKVGIKSSKYSFDSISETELVEFIENLNHDKNVNGILVQMPLPKNINPNEPETNPKFKIPWGIQRQSISIKAIQIKSDKKTQLKNVLKNKSELEAYREGELFTKIVKSTPVKSSIKGYLKRIVVLQVLHCLPCINQLIKGIFSRQDNWVLHFGQKLLGLMIEKLFGKR